MTTATDFALERRARQSLGASDDAIYAAAADALRRRGARGRIVDVGCGAGRLRTFLRDTIDSYAGVDAIRHEGLPNGIAFMRADLNRDPIPVPPDSADVAIAIETIEHLENPRAFVRELVRITKPGGWILVTTPNQRSLVSLGALLLKGHFSAFGTRNYPAHQTALLDTDLSRIAAENGLSDAAIEFTGVGRMPLSSARFPRVLSRLFRRAMSDNVLLVARKPASLCD
jgi:2-polyprenyl-3-methyl-5-hydroxy-6-metoxy-1,4-benzoquinol methylase